MKLKRILTLTAAAALTTALLTGCPWEQDDAASSEPSSSSSSSSHPSHDSDSGDDDSSAPPEQEETGPGYKVLAKMTIIRANPQKWRPTAGNSIKRIWKNIVLRSWTASPYRT